MKADTSIPVMRANSFSVEYNAGDCESPDWKTYVYGMTLTDAHFELIECLRDRKPTLANLVLVRNDGNSQERRVILSVEHGQSIDMILGSLREHLDYMENVFFDIKDKVNEAQHEKELLDEPYGCCELEIHNAVKEFTF